ncbi:hypothetical protein [Raineyella sp. LH-20]|uniref:hypothetical protein n=1 Tax=Raineyella sp. LH-20 TaxID=3081204 RepID=UPI0029530A79|nr:hypothetical protein [Raineyella sp. LH-20]WOP19299.1 hypothetical protein R0146_03235 [Raineyella sp. LH-20]
MSTTSTGRDVPAGSTRPTTGATGRTITDSTRPTGATGRTITDSTRPTGATEPLDDVSAAAAALRALAAADGGEVLARQLSRLVMVIADEAVRTKRFRGDLLAALTVEPVSDPAVSELTVSKPPASGPLTRTQLQRLTKADLKKLIDRGGMDRDRTLRSHSTKGEMVELILAFQMSPGEGTRTEDTPGADPAGAESALAVDPVAPRDTAAAVTEDPGLPANPPKRRRRPAPLDPYALAASEGVDGLRRRLRRLDIEALKDIIAEYGMNYDGRAMSWRDHHRFVERIVEKADFAATQGGAFRPRRKDL